MSLSMCMIVEARQAQRDAICILQIRGAEQILRSSTTSMSWTVTLDCPAIISILPPALELHACAYMHTSFVVVPSALVQCV